MCVRINTVVSPSRSMAEPIETPRAIDVHQRPRRSRNSDGDSSGRRSSRQSTSNAAAVNLVRSGTQFARPSLNLPHGYGKNFNCLLFSFLLLSQLFDFDFNSFVGCLLYVFRNANNTARSSVFLSYPIGCFNVA